MANTINALDSSFTNLINNLMTLERQPLDRLTKQRDTLNVQRGIYNDLKSKLDAFQRAVHGLKSSDPFFTLTPGRRVSISGITGLDGKDTTGTVAAATASASAITGSYKLENVLLAREHRVASDRQTYADQALGLAGDFIIGGAAARGQSNVALTAGTVTAFTTANPVSGQVELGSGSYYVETRNDATAGWQFRLVDVDGKALKIRLSDGSGYSSGWQVIPTALPDGNTYDTGRGLKISFGTDPAGFQAGMRGDLAHPPASLTYTAKGALVQVAATDSLNDIAASINKAAFPDGMGVAATVVDRQLILSSLQTGASHAITLSDGTGSVLHALNILNGSDGFTHQLQAARNASFTLNGLAVTRSQNSALTDVISGVTLNLAADAETKSATLNITSDMSAPRSAVNDFVSKFNDLQTYLGSKTSVTKNADKTYTRGALAGDNVLTTLRNDLFSLASRNTPNSGSLKSLREIGLTITDDMKIAISDQAKLDDALANKYEDVKLLLDAIMTGIDTKLGRFTGTGGYSTQAIKTVDTEVGNLDDQIKSWNTRLDTRKAALTDQYAQLQAQIIEMQYTQQMMSTIYGTLNTYG